MNHWRAVSVPIMMIRGVRPAQRPFMPNSFAAPTAEPPRRRRRRRTTKEGDGGKEMEEERGRRKETGVRGVKRWKRSEVEVGMKKSRNE